MLRNTIHLGMVSISVLSFIGPMRGCLMPNGSSKNRIETGVDSELADRTRCGLRRWLYGAC